MDFYDRIKELIKSRGLKLEPFLTELGIDYEKYKGQRRYNNLLRADEAVRLAKSLDTTVEYLVTGEYSTNIDSVKLNKIKPLIEQINQIM